MLLKLENNVISVNIVLNNKIMQSKLTTYTNVNFSDFINKDNKKKKFYINSFEHIA